MNAGYALLRLFWRPATLLSLFVLGVMGLAFVSLGASFVHGAGAVSDAGHAGRVALAVAIALGVLCGDGLRGIEYCPFSFALPGLRKQLLGTTLAIGSLAAVANAGLYIALGGELWPALIACAGLAWFALGTLLTDPFPSRVVAWASLAAAFVIMAGLERLSSWMIEAPWIAGALWLALAACIFVWRFRPSAERARALAPTWALPSAHRPAARSTALGPQALSGKIARGWQRSLRGDRPEPWIRAALYESFGWSRVGWLHASFQMALFAVGGVVVMALFDGAPDGVTMSGATLIWSALADPAPFGVDPPKGLSYQTVALTAAVSMEAFQFTGISLHRGLLHPISRRQRARVTYRLFLLQTLGHALVIALGFTLLAELTRRLADDIARGEARWFGYLLPLSVTLLVTPLVQWLRVRWLGGGCERGRRTANMLLKAGTTAGFVLLVILLTQLSVVFARGYGLIPTVVVAAGLFVAGQWTLRAWLAHWTARRDLI